MLTCLMFAQGSTSPQATENERNDMNGNVTQHEAEKHAGEEYGLWCHTAWSWALALPLSGCVT